MARGKSAGLAHYKADILRDCQPGLYTNIAKLFTILAQHSYPKTFNTLIIMPLWKHKGSKDDPKTYRGISLIHPLGRLFAKCVEARLESDPRAAYADAQGGFRKHHRCEDQCLILQMIYECAQADRQRVLSVFVDLEKAYDRVDRNKLYTALVL